VPRVSPKVPLQRRLLSAHQGERARPELLDQCARVGGHADGERIQGGRRRDKHRWRHGASASLRHQETFHRRRGEGIGTDAVHRVGGEHDELTALDRERRVGQACLSFDVLGGLEAHGHGAHRASRAVR